MEVVVVAVPVEDISGDFSVGNRPAGGWPLLAEVDMAMAMKEADSGRYLVVVIIIK